MYQGSQKCKCEAIGRVMEIKPPKTFPQSSHRSREESVSIQKRGYGACVMNQEKPEDGATKE